MWHELLAALEDAVEELGSAGMVLESGLAALGRVIDLPGFVDTMPRGLSEDVVAATRGPERVQVRDNAGTTALRTSSCARRWP
jgi:hypothetical protein